jgi:hypothetical protein
MSVAACDEFHTGRPMLMIILITCEARHRSRPQEAKYHQGLISNLGRQYRCLSRGASIFKPNNEHASSRSALAHRDPACLTSTEQFPQTPKGAQLALARFAKLAARIRCSVCIYRKLYVALL